VNLSPKAGWLWKTKRVAQPLIPLLYTQPCVLTMDKVGRHTAFPLRYIAFPVLFILVSLLGLWTLSGQQVRKIDINADFMEFNSELGINAKRLIGNVTFKHDDVLMTCDSAWYFSEENTVEAYSRVHLWQGDTLDLYGDYLRYQGNIKLAKVRKNVLLIDKENRLTTDYIDYDFANNLAYYLNGGKIINGNNTILSQQAYYYTKEKVTFFKDSVSVTNPEYTMYSDTLKYNTVTEVSYFLGPTDIIADDNYIYCENGWYDTQNNISQFNKNAFLESGDKKLKGDSIYYERNTGIGKAFKNVELIDTSQKIVLMGDKAIYNEKSEHALLTDRALMIQIDDAADSMFIHADTLQTVSDTIPDKKLILAYYHVKIYRSDLQGKCDSLVYSDVDSVFRFFGEPVLWSEENQLSSEFIEIYTKNQKLDRIDMRNTAFIISQEDSSRFNQIKGRSMTGYFEDNQLSVIDVDGNGQTLYFAKEKNEIIAANKTLSSSLRIYLKDKKISRINFINKPEATYYPLSKLPEDEARLEDFKWFDSYRPRSRHDVFVWAEEDRKTLQ
jgi:lipopolysaccharide export system protein LptA